MGNRTVKFIRILLCLILALGVVTVFRACGAREDGSWMHCHRAQTDVLVIGIVMSAVSVVSLFIKSRGIRLALDIADALLAAAAVLIPGTIVKMCMMSSMRCHSVMKPFVFVSGILVILVSVIDAVQTAGGKR